MVQLVKHYKFDLYLRNGSVIRNCLARGILPSLSDDVINFTLNLNDPFKGVMIRAVDVMLISVISVTGDPDQPTDVALVEFE